jgi:hypothetical protein
MISAKAARVLLTVLIGYVLFGVILFPKWYYFTLREGGIDALVYRAQTTYLVWNIIAIVFAAAITSAYQFASTRGYRGAAAVDRIAVYR